MHFKNSREASGVAVEQSTWDVLGVIFQRPLLQQRECQRKGEQRVGLGAKG